MQIQVMYQERSIPEMNQYVNVMMHYGNSSRDREDRLTHTNSNGDNPIWDLAPNAPNSVEEVVTEHMLGGVLFEWR
jgi:hypothetical protein